VVPDLGQVKFRKKGHSQNSRIAQDTGCVLVRLSIQTSPAHLTAGYSTVAEKRLIGIPRPSCVVTNDSWYIRALYEVGIIVVYQNQAGAAVLQYIRDFVWFESSIDRCQDGSGSKNTIVGI
jgi:hypothetical protein